MSVTLLESPDQSARHSRREVEKLLGEVAQLHAEVAELRQRAGYWKGMFEQAKRKNEKLQKEVDSLRAENRQLKDRLFAAKSEKKPSKDRSNGLDDPKAANEPGRPRGQQPGASGPLTLFVDDPKIPMDNNASERMVRGPAMGRKNYLGSGSLWSVCLTAAMFSIVATLKQWKINPRRWLSWYLESCAVAGSRVPKDIEQFLPWNLTTQRRAELTSHKASVPISDTS